MAEGKTIKTADVMKRLEMVLDNSCHKLFSVQEVISHYIATGRLDETQMERLQGLDALTQEIEAVRSVLKRIGHSMVSLENVRASLDFILEDVHLSQVRYLLNHGKHFDDKEIHGDVTFF